MMPVYVYRCPKCKKIIEVRQSMTDHPEPMCPECKDVRLGRVITAPHLINMPTGGSRMTYNTKDPKQEEFDQLVRDGKLPYEADELIY